MAGIAVTSGGGLELSVVCDPRFEGDAYRRLRGVGHIVRGTCLSNAVTGILQLRAKTNKPIEILRFFGHGEPGWQDVGTVGYYDQRIAYVPDQKKSLYGRVSLLKLAGTFAKGAWIELRGCHIAEGQVGEALLIAVARLLNVDVAGAEGLQTNEDDPTEWENAVKFASPGGTISRVAVRRKLNDQGYANY